MPHSLGSRSIITITGGEVGLSESFFSLVSWVSFSSVEMISERSDFLGEKV